MATRRHQDQLDDGLAARLFATRALTLDLAAPLSDADATIQPHPDASPAKWHLAHTTWFFETFVLRDHVPGYALHDERFAFLFNSYYEGEGERHARARRGMISRPSLDEIRDWRGVVDAALATALPALPAEALELVALGIEHEQQHQELFLTDILATFAENPTEPVYAALDPAPAIATEPMTFLPGREGLVEIGAAQTASPSIASARATAPCSTRTPSPTAASPTANGPSSSPTAAMTRPPCGSAKAGTGASAKRSRPRSTGAARGRRSRSPGGGRSTPPRRSRTFPITKPTPLRAGRASACRPSSNGRTPSPPATRGYGHQLDGAGAVLPRPGGGPFGDVWQWTQSAYLPYPGFAPEAGHRRRI